MELDRQGNADKREETEGQSEPEPGCGEAQLLRPPSFPLELIEPQFCEEQSGSPMSWEAPHIYSRETKRMCLAGLWQGVNLHQDYELVACKAAVTDYGRAFSPPWPEFSFGVRRDLE